MNNHEYPLALHLFVFETLDTDYRCWCRRSHHLMQCLCWNKLYFVYIGVSLFVDIYHHGYCPVYIFAHFCIQEGSLMRRRSRISRSVFHIAQSCLLTGLHTDVQLSIILAKTFFHCPINLYHKCLGSNAKTSPVTGLFLRTPEICLLICSLYPAYRTLLGDLWK